MKPPIKDPPRKGQPPYKGRSSSGPLSHSSSAFLTLRKGQPLNRGQSGKVSFIRRFHCSLHTKDFARLDSPPSPTSPTSPRYQPASEEDLVKAFTVLDDDHKSHLTPEDLKQFMTEEGEPFTQEELDEMMTAAMDPDRGVILYKDFVTLMLPEGELT